MMAEHAETSYAKLMRDLKISTMSVTVIRAKHFSKLKSFLQYVAAMCFLCHDGALVSRHSERSLFVYTSGLLTVFSVRLTLFGKRM